MSGEPQNQSRAWIIGSPILLGAAVGLLIATRRPQSLETAVKSAVLGSLLGLATGIAIWFWRRSS